MFKAINKRLKNKKGFTLVELIVVLAVLGIIAGIAVPNFTGIQAKAKIKADKATAVSIAKAAEISFANGETETDSETIATLVGNHYLESVPEPQSAVQEDGSTVAASFTVDINPATGKAIVYYNDGTDNGNQLYPES